MSCKLTYQQLLTMLTKANRAYDHLWQLGLYKQANRYHYIANRVLQAMDNYKHLAN